MSAVSRRCAACGGTTTSRLTLSQFKAMVREQFFLLLLDEEAALEAIPKMLPANRRRASQGVGRDQPGAERNR